MSQQFLSQARELWETIASPDTRKSYQGTFALTWQIFQRLGKTLWLGICLILVAADWVGSTAIASGRSLRSQLEGLQEVQSEELASQTGQRVVEAGKTGVVNAIANARKQLGLAEKPTMFALLAAVPEEASEGEAVEEKAEAIAQTSKQQTLKKPV